MNRIALTLLAALCAAPAAAAPQAPADTGAATPAGHRLFDATTPLALTLTADFDAIGKEKGAQKHNYPAKLAYVGPAGDSVTLDVQLHSRGHFRLNLCQFAPLKVLFDRTETPHTVFAHQGGLKLVVQCRGNTSYANYLLEEYLIYQLYNQVTERSFRARLARVTYVDATGKHPPDTRHAFFIEDDGRMARRNHAQVLEQKGVYQADVDFNQMGLVAVFEYMIGNTDFSVAALHNIVLIRDSSGVLYPVPYDFDWSGVISPPYAKPDPHLEIHYVRERVFRGSCRTPGQLAPLFSRFNAQKDTIYALYRGMEGEGLEKKRIEQALDYYNDFYKTINDAGRTKREFIDSCLQS